MGAVPFKTELGRGPARLQSHPPESEMLKKGPEVRRGWEAESPKPPTDATPWYDHGPPYSPQFWNLNSLWLHKPIFWSYWNGGAHVPVTAIHFEPYFVLIQSMQTYNSMECTAVYVYAMIKRLYFTRDRWAFPGHRHLQFKEQGLVIICLDERRNSWHTKTAALTYIIWCSYKNMMVTIWKAILVCIVYK